MKKNILFCCLFLYACNQSKKKNDDNDLQKLSSIFPTANWLVTDGLDTSYMYFSPQIDNTYKIYEYKLVHGDSSLTWQGSILKSGDSVIWNWDHHLLWLQEISDSAVNWKENSSNTNYILQKINDSSLQLKSSSGQLIFTRTLPLSTFLIRAKYDYEYGTQFLDSGEVRPRKRIR